MRTNRNLLAIAAGLICCIVVVWFSTSIYAREEIYEIRPQIAIPEYKTDTARIIDAYERLMDRYMGLTEGNLIRIGTDVQSIIKKLNSINGKLTKLSARMTAIEKVLGIEQPKPPAGKKP